MKADGKTRGLVMMQWGWVPHWAHGERPRAFINAKSETTADGFYEWAEAGGRRQPHHFRLAGGRLFEFAALWGRWRGPRGANASCAILTTDANDFGTAEVRCVMTPLPPA